jgi:hypothetical protein
VYDVMLVVYPSLSWKALLISWIGLELSLICDALQSTTSRANRNKFIATQFGISTIRTPIKFQ